MFNVNLATINKYTVQSFFLLFLNKISKFFEECFSTVFHQQTMHSCNKWRLPFFFTLDQGQSLYRISAQATCQLVCQLHVLPLGWRAPRNERTQFQERIRSLASSANTGWKEGEKQSLGQLLLSGQLFGSGRVGHFMASGFFGRVLKLGQTSDFFGSISEIV